MTDLKKCSAIRSRFVADSTVCFESLQKTSPLDSLVDFCYRNWNLKIFHELGFMYRDNFYIFRKLTDLPEKLE